MKYKKILITGGAGFVGSNIAIFYKESYPESEVVSLDNLKRRGSELNVERLKKNGVTYVHGDIRNPDDLRQAGQADLVIECSAECSVLAGYNSSPMYLLETNLFGAVNCLEYARQCGSDFIFLSTSRVYPIEKLNSLKFTEKDTRYELDAKQPYQGVSVKGISEDFPLDGVRSLYGTTKLSAEMLVQEYIDAYGIKGIINRCGVISGPWQMGKVDQGFVALWVARHIFGGKLSYIGYGGAGKQVRDIIHVRDLFSAIEIQLRDINAHNGKIYNIGGGHSNSISLKELTSLAEEITKKKIKIDSVPETHKVDIRSFVTDYSRFNEATGWAPRINNTKLIEDITVWIMSNKEVLSKVFL